MLGFRYVNQGTCHSAKFLSWKLQFRLGSGLGWLWLTSLPGITIAKLPRALSSRTATTPFLTWVVQPAMLVSFQHHDRHRYGLSSGCRYILLGLTGYRHELHLRMLCGSCMAITQNSVRVERCHQPYYTLGFLVARDGTPLMQSGSFGLILLMPVLLPG